MPSSIGERSAAPSAVGFFPANPVFSPAAALLARLLLGPCFFLLATRIRPAAGT